MLSYLNNQPDMLTGMFSLGPRYETYEAAADTAAILKHRTKHKGKTGDLFILPLPKTLDRMTLLTHPPGARSEPVEVDIMFDPPMEDFTEFRHRVLGYRDEAFKHFKVVSRGYFTIALGLAMRATRYPQWL
jgi:hypothetical protein